MQQDQQSKRNNSKKRRFEPSPCFTILFSHFKNFKYTIVLGNKEKVSLLSRHTIHSRHIVLTK
jgi:hypothetical protein